MFKHSRSYLYVFIFSVFLSLSALPRAHAASVNYTLDNIILDIGPTSGDRIQQLTGNFTWTFNEGDFEGGTGVFNDIFIPRQTGFFFGPVVLADLSISIDVTKSIEITLASPVSIDGDGLDISLAFLQPLTQAEGSLLDLDILNSSYSSGGSGIKQPFFSGRVIPELVTVSPVLLPAATWLFGSFLIGFFSFSKRRKIF